MPNPENFRWHAQYRCLMCGFVKMDDEGCKAYGTLHEVLDGLDRKVVHQCQFGRIGIMELEGVIRSIDEKEATN